MDTLMKSLFGLTANNLSGHNTLLAEKRKTRVRAVSFSDTPSVQHAPEGDTGVVLCNVKSDPKPVVNWYFEGTKISE
ncbi:ig-like domain-containing protein, partial [Trichonephila clavipes]